MKKIKLLLVLAVSLMAVSCTNNNRVKNYGGSRDIELPKGEKLVNITWKDGQVWYLTRQMEANEVPIVSKFREKSQHGFLEGTIVIHESK